MTLIFIIDFESKPSEQIIPDKVRFTSSKNQQTSTLTLTFFNLNFLMDNNFKNGEKKVVKCIYFLKDDYKFFTKDIQIIWSKGRPFFLEAIFLITSEIESIILRKLFYTISKKKDFLS